MGKASPAITSLNAGEFAPEMEGRTDIAKYPNACKTMQNFMPLVQGPARRRGGSRFVNEVKNSTKRVWYHRFEFSITQAFVLEFGDQYIRFYTLHGQLQVSGVAAWSAAPVYPVGFLVVSGGINYYCILSHNNQVPPNATYWYPLSGTIYEIPTPYTLANLTNVEGSFALKIEQSGDVLYIAGNGIYEAQTLTRFGNTNWVLSPYRPNDGPLLEQNTVSTITIIASGISGSVTLTASGSPTVFASTDVNRLVRLDVQNFDIAPWESAKGYVIGDLVRSVGITYKALNGATSGTAPPTHFKGNAYDGKTGVLWAYQDATYGIARITAFASGTSVTATVIVDPASGLNQLPVSVTTTATQRWQLGAWSASTEYPRAVKFFRDRLFWAGKLRYWGSVTGLYTSHATDFFNQVTTAAGIAGVLSATDVNNISWLMTTDKLIIGTAGGEFALSEITTVNPLGPANVKTPRQSTKRCRIVQPELIGASLQYVQRAGRKLMSMEYDITTDLYRSADQSALAYHMTKSGIVDMSYQSEPYSMLWLVLVDGSLIAFTFDREQECVAWHRHPIGGNGFVEAVETIPSPDGGRDEVWICVRRTINGVTKRYVEYLEKPWEAGDAQNTVFYVDAGLTYSGAPATTISGLSHLEGQVVQVVVDGASHPDRTVTGGAITLQAPASVVQVGLQSKAKLVTSRIDAGSDIGTSQGKLKRANTVSVRFIDTLGGFIGLENRTLDEFQFRDPSMPMDSPPAIFSGDKRIQFPGDYDTDCRIQIEQDQPFPMTVVGIYPSITGYEPT